MENPVIDPSIIKDLDELQKPTYEGESAGIPTEAAQKLFTDEIKGDGGIYLGTSTHQNFTYIAAAESEFAFIVDRNRTAIDIMRAHRLAHLNIATPSQYVDFWSMKRTEQKQLIESWKLLPADEILMKQIASKYGEKIGLVLHFDRIESEVKPYKQSWLGKPEDYDRIRKMFQEQRIQIVNADVQNEEVFSLMAQAANKLGLPFNTIYSSNIEDHLGGIIRGVKGENINQFWKNISQLPASEKSKILRTVRTLGNLSPDHNFHYVIQQLDDFKNKKYDSYQSLTDDIAAQITEKSLMSTVMPRPESERDGYMARVGWPFP